MRKLKRCMECSSLVEKNRIRSSFCQSCFDKILAVKVRDEYATEFGGSVASGKNKVGGKR